MSRIHLIRYPVATEVHYEYRRLEDDWHLVDTLTTKLVEDSSIELVLASNDPKMKLVAEFIATQLGRKQLRLGKCDVGLVVSEIFRERNLGERRKNYGPSIYGGHGLHIAFCDDDMPGGESKSAFRQRIQEAHDRYVKPVLNQGQSVIIMGDYFWLNEYRDLKLHGAQDVKIPTLGRAVLEANGNYIREISIDILKW